MRTRTRHTRRWHNGEQLRYAPIIAVLLFAATAACSDESTTVSPPRYSQTSDSTVAVGDSSTLEISNFAGLVTVTAGAAGSSHIVVRRWSGTPSNLDEIDVVIEELQNGLHVTTTNPLGLSNVSVDLEAMVPADTRPSIMVGAGQIHYAGSAEGESFFGTGAGNITLRLPASVNVEVSLTAAAGSVRVDFPVVGQVGTHTVEGIIGTGADGRIVAQAGAGEILVTRQ